MKKIWNILIWWWYQLRSIITFVLLHNSYAGMKGAITKHQQSGLWPDSMCVHAAAIKLSKRNCTMHHSWGTASGRGVCVMLLQNWTRCFWAIWECWQLWMREILRLTNAVDFMSAEYMANFICRTKNTDIYCIIWSCGLASLVNININSRVIGHFLGLFVGGNVNLKNTVSMVVALVAVVAAVAVATMLHITHYW